EPLLLADGAARCGTRDLPRADREVGRGRLRPLPAAGVLQVRLAAGRRGGAAGARRPGARAADVPVDRDPDVEVPPAATAGDAGDRPGRELAISARRSPWD